jgi:hypothetical protein
MPGLTTKPAPNVFIPANLKATGLRAVFRKALWHELVAHTVNGSKMNWTAWINLKFPSQSAYVIIDRTRRGIALVTPGLVQ